MVRKEAISACEIIRKDHADIKKLLQNYDIASDAKEKETIVRELGLQLTEHARIDEELIFPAAAQMAEDNSFIDKLKESDNSVKMHLAQIQRLYADIDKEEFEQRMKELKEAICTLIEHEETSLIPCIENPEYNLDELGEEVAKLRAGESIGPIRLRKRA